jgi:SAM-dependent methyltransferase
MTFNNLRTVARHKNNFVAEATRWNEFAHIDPYTYICTKVPRGDRQAFWECGELVVRDELLPTIHRLQGRLGTALELGCGVGRLLLPMAGHFRQVVGLDISDEMVRLGRELAAERRVANVEFIHIADPYDLKQQLATSGGSVDFAYSLLVFQHIDCWPILDAYIEAVSFLLAPNGIAYLQFDTRRKNLAYQAKMVLPDFVLPRFLRRGIRRIRRDPADLEAVFAEVDLHLAGSITPGTNYHCYVLRKSVA